MTDNARHASTRSDLPPPPPSSPLSPPLPPPPPAAARPDAVKIGGRGRVTVSNESIGRITLDLPWDINASSAGLAWDWAEVYVQPVSPPNKEIWAKQRRRSPVDGTEYTMIGLYNDYVWVIDDPVTEPLTFQRSLVETWEITG